MKRRTRKALAQMALNSRSPKRKKAANPLRVDPTRTLTLRRTFTTRLRKQFALLKGRIIRLVVDEDVFGLNAVSHDPFTFNVIDASGHAHDEKGLFTSKDGGGAADGALSKLKSAAGKIGHAEHAIAAYATDKIGAAVAKLPPPAQKAVQFLYGAGKKGIGVLFTNFTVVQAMAERAAIERGLSQEEARRLRGVLSTIDNKTFEVFKVGALAGIHAAHLPAYISASLPVASTAYLAYSTARNPMATYRAAKGLIKEGLSSLAKKLHLTKNVVGDDRYSDLIDALQAHKFDDWYIALLSAAMDEVSIPDAIKLANAVYDDHPKVDVPTTNTRWQFASDPEKVKAFTAWLKQQTDSLITGQTEDQLWQRYIQEGFNKGAGRAFDDTRKSELINKHPEYFTDEGQAVLSDFYLGTKDEFLRSAFAQPVAQERVQLLVARTFEDLKNVTTDMATRLGRVLVDGFVQQLSPKQVARNLTDAVDLSRSRAELIARTEIIRAHAEGQLTAFDKLGVEEVGVAAEWSTAGDGRVCEECQPLEGIVLKVDEARGMLPRHPGCRCAWIPANVGEDDDGQKRSPSEIRDAIEESTEAEGGEEESDWIGADADIDKNRPQSILNVNFEVVPQIEILDTYLINEEGNCGIGPGGFQPGNTCAKGGGTHTAHLPAPDDLDVIKTLPGSTAPKLAQDENGKKWVLKNNTGKEAQLKNEADADAAYRALGIPTVTSGIATTADGQTVKISEYMEGAKTLAEWQQTATTSEKEAMYKKIGEHMAADALLANWDVVGLSKDNIVVKDGVPYRIDNGGALKYRAQGAPKGSKFGGEVGELSTLRNPNLNPSAASVFKYVTDADLHKQVTDLLKKKDAVLEALSDPQTKDILSKRFTYLKEWADTHGGALTSEAPKPTPSGPLSTPFKPAPASPASVETAKPASQIHTGEGLAAHMKAKFAGRYGLTEHYWKKFAAANPQGIGSKEILIPQQARNKADPQGSAKRNADQKEMAEHIASMAGPGTKVKTAAVWHSAKTLGVTKTFGEEQYTTKTKEEVEVESPKGVSTVGASGIPGHLLPHFPPVIDGKVTMGERTWYDKEAHSAWIKTLTSDEEQAINSWKGSAKSIRKAVADNQPTPESTAFMSAITKEPGMTGVTYRGISGKYAEGIAQQIEEQGVGGYWSDPSPHCMSIHSHKAGDFSNGQIMFRVVTKTGRPIHKVDGFDSEAEVTGMPGVNYRIHGIHKQVTVTNHDGSVRKVKHLIDLVEAHNG